MNAFTPERSTPPQKTSETRASDGHLTSAERAARLLGAHETLSRAISLPIPPVDAADRAEYDRAVATLRGVLGEARLDLLGAGFFLVLLRPIAAVILGGLGGLIGKEAARLLRR